MIKFVETDSEAIYNDIVEKVETELGEKLAEGDERKLFIKGLMPIIIALKNDINDTGNQNLLEFARDDKVDYLAKEYHDTERLLATEAICDGKVELSEARSEDTIIEAGKRVSPDGILMYKIRYDVVIPAGETTKDIKLISASTGAKYNGYKPGTINKIVDPIPYVSKIYNIETSNSGSDLEPDSEYKERARLELESKSTAGPEGAYEYFAYSADNSISFVKVRSPEPGEVKILATVDNGEIPNQEILDKISSKCSARDVRPLTDKVTTGVPNKKEYDIELTYYLDKNLDIYEGKWRKSIEGNNFDYTEGAIKDYILWQQSEIGKTISPDELAYKIQDAASYTVEDKKISGVRRIIITSPEHVILDEEELAKADNIKVTYGGLE